MKTMERSNIPRVMTGWLQFAFIAFIAFECSIFAARSAVKNSASLESNANQFVRDVMANEVKVQQDDKSLWQYRQNKIENGKIEVFNVVETRQGDLERLISVDGHALPPDRERKEEARIRHLLTDRDAFRTERRKQEDDFAQEQQFLQTLASAFDYQDAGQEGNLLKLTFAPKPTFHPPTRECEVLHHMTGTLWLDLKQKRLARISGVLTSEVNFGWGILGHLAKGGTFDVEQGEIGNGLRELTRLKVNMDGKALFFKTIAVQQNVRNSDFRPVRAEATLQEAAELLKSNSTTSARTLAGN